jgi:Glycosyltransferase family 87
MSSGRSAGFIGSGIVVALGIVGTSVALLALCRVVGWDPTWRAFGVTPLQPPFFDMHVINDYAACAWKGIDAYAPAACNVDSYNIPPTWLWLGFLGIDGKDSVWLSAAVIVAAAIVMVLLLQGRCWFHGVIALFAIVSPSVLMGVERGNLDLLILALVGAAALIYEERRVGRACGAIALLGLGVALKLFPMFCVSLVARFSRRTFIFACVTAAMSLVYLDFAMKYVFLIRRNVPTTFILSYGYKTVFLGVDHIRSEAGLSPIGLGDTWVPASTVAVVLTCAAVVAVNCFRNGRVFCSVDESAAGTAFLFGAGIYCGTYLLGTNFIYRLMFLLLCVPQLQDWQTRRRQDNEAAGIAELGLFGAVLGVLWLNGNANGHSIFLIVPQLLNWLLFFCMAVVLMLNLLRSCDVARGRRPRDGAACNR